MPSAMQVKRGDTLSYIGKISRASIPDFTGWTVAAAAKDAQGTLLATLTAEWVVVTPLPASFRISAPYAVTELWTPGVYQVDVQFTSPGGQRASTQTFDLVVLADIT